MKPLPSLTPARAGAAPLQSIDRLQIARRIAARFRRPWHRDYVRMKLRFDPAYNAVADLVAAGDTALLDVGCGMGLLGFYLRECGFRADYHGADFDAEKIAEARRIACQNGIDLRFEAAEAGTLPPFSGHVALLDMLHYLPEAQQQHLLREACSRVAPGALLIVRNVLRERSWRFYLTVWEERCIYALRWMRSPARHFPRRAEVEYPLREAGLDIDVSPLWGCTPFNSFIVVARRKN